MFKESKGIGRNNREVSDIYSPQHRHMSWMKIGDRCDAIHPSAVSDQSHAILPLYLGGGYSGILPTASSQAGYWQMCSPE